jgi:ribosomal protein L44E
MAEFDDALSEFNTVQQIEQQRQRQKQKQQQAQAQRQQRRSADTVGGALEPVLDAEKTDIQFWMMVAQTVLLLVIARELRSGG